MRNKYYTSRDPIKNYFPLPNEVFALGLSPGALAVYSYLMYTEDRTTYQCHAIHLGIPPRTPQGTRPLTRISGFTRTHPRRRAGKAGGLLSFTKRISREPPVNGLSRHILAKTPVFHAPVDNGSAPISCKGKAPVYTGASCRSYGNPNERRI